MDCPLIHAAFAIHGVGHNLLNKHNETPHLLKFGVTKSYLEYSYVRGQELEVHVHIVACCLVRRGGKVS